MRIRKNFPCAEEEAKLRIAGRQDGVGHVFYELFFFCGHSFLDKGYDCL